jgi:hypothetical protein
MNKLVLLGIVAILVILIIMKLKLMLFGIALGALATIVYFSVTGSTLNWIKPKK